MATSNFLIQSQPQKQSTSLMPALKGATYATVQANTQAQRSASGSNNIK